MVRVADIPIDAMNAQSGSTLMGNLGIQYTFASKDCVEGTMPVDLWVASVTSGTSMSLPPPTNSSPAFAS